MPLQGLFQAGFRQIRLQHFDAQHKVPQQAAFVRIIIGDAARKFADFADIVKQRSREKRLPVKLGVMVRDAAAKLEHAQGVLEQPARIGVVNALGRRANAKGGPQLFIVEKPLRQLAPGRINKFLFEKVQHFVQHFVQRKGAGWHDRYGRERRHL